jgi:hypothetical protein
VTAFDRAVDDVALCPTCGRLASPCSIKLNGHEHESRVAPRWSELAHLVEGMRQRGHGEAACDYLASCLGLAFAKGWNARDREIVAGAP